MSYSSGGYGPGREAQRGWLDQKDAREAEPDEVLYEGDRGPREDPGKERLVVRKRSYQGHPFIDVRVMFRGEQGEYLPTKKGVSIKAMELEAVARAFTAAAKGMGERGGAGG